MAPKSATSANAQPTSTAPVPSRPSTPSKTGASSAPEALANEKIDDQAVTAQLVNGLEKNSRNQFETLKKNKPGFKIVSGEKISGGNKGDHFVRVVSDAGILAYEINGDVKACMVTVMQVLQFSGKLNSSRLSEQAVKDVAELNSYSKLLLDVYTKVPSAVVTWTLKSDENQTVEISWTDAKSKKPTAVKETGDYSLMTRRARIKFNNMFTDAK